MSKDPQKIIKALEKRIAKLESRACIHEGVFARIDRHLHQLEQDRISKATKSKHKLWPLVRTHYSVDADGNEEAHYTNVASQ